MAVNTYTNVNADDYTCECVNKTLASRVQSTFLADCKNLIISFYQQYLFLNGLGIELTVPWLESQYLAMDIYIGFQVGYCCLVGCLKDKCNFIPVPKHKFCDPKPCQNGGGGGGGGE